MVVKHEGWPYAGFVEDIDFYEGHMDALGKNVANNIYSGRNKFRGQCIWYPHHNLPAFLPAPVMMDRGIYKISPPFKKTVQEDNHKITTHIYSCSR